MLPCTCMLSHPQLKLSADVYATVFKQARNKHNNRELARCVGCLCTRSGWFKHSEPHRSYTLHTSTERARCVGYLCTSSGWFKHLEPHRTYTKHTSTERARCLGCLCSSSGGSSTSNLSDPTRSTQSQR